MEEWVWVAWHLKSAPSFDDWLGWSISRRALLREKLNIRIREHNSLLEI